MQLGSCETVGNVGCWSDRLQRYKTSNQGRLREMRLRFDYALWPLVSKQTACG